MSDNDQRMIFSKNLNYFLELNNKTQKEVADELNIGLSTFNSWCTGTKMPRMDKIQRIADYFRISKSDLIDNKSDKQEQGYYINEETNRIAQEIFDNKDLRILFDASRKAKPEDLKFIIEMAKRFKGED